MLTVLKLLLMLALTYLGLLTKAAKEEKEFNLNFQQNDYYLTFERLELVRYNKEFLYDDISVITRKYNRSQPVINATFTLKKDVSDDVSATIQAYKFMSNEYRYFPIRFAANVCKAFAANTFGIRQMFACGNIRGCRCFKNQTYHICNFYPDGSKFPPLIPNGQYKIEIQINSLSTEIALVNGYSVISRPVKE